MCGLTSDLVARLRVVPFKFGGSDWDGADCWGVCVLWFRKRFGIELKDRSDIAPGPSGVDAGVENATDWIEVQHPQNDDLVVMRHGRLRHGHVGVFWNGAVIHADQSHGCVVQPINGRLIRSRITCFLRHKTIA